MGKNTKKQYDVIIIGAGASGMMSAITAARENKKVLIIEKLDKAGKKLLATGNGKCNFTNANMSTACFGGDKNFITYVLEQFSVSDCLKFFQSIGIYPKNRNGYYYPNSEQAASVVNAFLEEIERLEIEILYSTKIQTISPYEEKVVVGTDNGIFTGRKLIIATGLLAAPKLGSDGSLFEVIKMLGHRFQPILPALCGFYCKGINFKKTSGVRATGTVTAIIDGKENMKDTGEIQFADYGLSGIPIFQISRILSKGLYQKSDVKIAINLLPEMTYAEILEELYHRKIIKNSQTADKFLNGLVNQKLGDMILEKARIDKDMFVSSLKDTDMKHMAFLLQNITVSVTKYRDFEFAQVCTGGISPSEIHTSTLESKFVQNIYFAGEILDVDGICGGYNLHFAWATGYIAGKAVSK